MCKKCDKLDEVLKKASPEIQEVGDVFVDKALEILRAHGLNESASLKGLSEVMSELSGALAGFSIAVEMEEKGISEIPEKETVRVIEALATTSAQAFSSGLQVSINGGQQLLDATETSDGETVH